MVEGEEGLVGVADVEVVVVVGVAVVVGSAEEEGEAEVEGEDLVGQGECRCVSKGAG